MNKQPISLFRAITHIAIQVSKGIYWYVITIKTQATWNSKLTVIASSTEIIRTTNVAPTAGFKQSLWTPKQSKSPKQSTFFIWSNCQSDQVCSTNSVQSNCLSCQNEPNDLTCKVIWDAQLSRFVVWHGLIYPALPNPPICSSTYTLYMIIFSLPLLSFTWIWSKNIKFILLVHFIQKTILVIFLKK